MPPYTSPWENEELRLLRESTRKFLEKEFVPHLNRWLQQGMLDREAWSQAGEMGLLLPSIPEEYGGAGGTFAHEAVVIEEVEKSGIGGNLGYPVHSTICPHYLLHYGTEEQKQRWLPKMATGEMIGAIAMSEPGTGSDLQSIQTRAVRDGSHYVINGAKTFITNGQHADLILLCVKTGEGKGSRNISIVVVEAENTPGFQRGRKLDKIGMKAADTSELFFSDARVPVENLLGEEGRGFYYLMQQLPQERLALAVAAVAAIEHAVEITVDYTRNREAFGQRLLDFQNTRFTLAECKTEAHIARVFVDSCIERIIRGELDNETASMAKWWCTQKQCEIVDTCLQLHGGYGYMSEYEIARMFTDARVQKIYGGSNEIMKELIGRSL
ncbi:MAG: acyl-CoA dehydrogenase family protein [bacterium]|jgi:acyl-CoA dehydrogenase